MNKTLIALLAFMGSVLVPVQAGESLGGASGDVECKQSLLIDSGTWHCSHHPIPYEMLERLECVDERCEIKKDSKTGDYFMYIRLELEDGERPWGYIHSHEGETMREWIDQIVKELDAQMGE